VARGDASKVVAEEREHLYGLPLDEFTAARNARVRELRAAGDREAAQAVSRLPKPSVAAWAVNQLVRHQRQEVQELLRLGGRVREAQTALLQGRGKRETLDEELRAERTLTRQLGGTARGLLADAGQKPSETTLERVRQTLHAAAPGAGATCPVTQAAPRRRILDALGAQATGARRDELRAAERTAREARRAVDRAVKEAEKAEAGLREARERLAEAESRQDAANAAVREARGR
jgi:hypothetical protein